jgi:hypothetical protein
MKPNLQLLQFQLANKLKANAEKKVKLSNKGTLVPWRLAHHRTSKLLFSQPMPNTGKKYKCEFLLDVSGSMWRREMKPAIETLQNLIKLFYWIIDFKITCFGNGSYPMSAREILSINLDKFWNNWSEQCRDYSCELFNRPMSLQTFNWEEHLIPFEGGEKSVGWFTWWIWAVAKAGADLIAEDWERFVVIITDGWDNQYYPDDDRNLFVCWAPVNTYNKYTYVETEEELNANWINILPIWIGGNRPRYKNSISLDNPEDIYEKTIQFIDKHFW